MMTEFEEKLKSALQTGTELPEGKLEQMRKETLAMYEKEKKNNERWTIWMTAAGFVAAALWFYLFWNAESTKFQILWASLLVGEGLGIGVLYVGHLVTDNGITERKEHREIELRIAALEERLVKASEQSTL